MQFESFTGTAQEFIQAGVEVNGQKVDTVSISILARYGIAKLVGVEVKTNPSKRGRNGLIYKLVGKSGLVVKVPAKAELTEKSALEVA